MLQLNQNSSTVQDKLLFYKIGQNMASVIISASPPTAANFLEFTKELCDFAATLCTQYYEYGLLHLLLTQQQWEEQTTVGNERPINGLRPELKASPNSSDLRKYNEALDKFQKVALGTSLLKQTLLTGIGSDNVAAISDPVTSTRKLSIEQIMVQVTTLIGTPTAAVIEGYQAALELPIGELETFECFITKHIMLHTKLQMAGVAVPAFNKVSLLGKAISSRPELAEAAKMYKISTPQPLDQNFLSMCTYIKRQAPNMSATTKSAGYAGGAFAGGVTESDTIRELREEIKQLRSELRQSKAGTGATQQLPQQCYCYFHGYDKGHWGSVCKRMENSTSPVYTVAQKAAKKHSEVEGGSIARGAYTKPK